MYSFNSCRNTYGKEIGDKEQPLLIHRPKRTNRGLQRRRGSAGNDAPDEVCGCMHACIHAHTHDFVCLCRMWSRLYA